jgi:PIN domain nuclease of toxin-antitoxin system
MRLLLDTNILVPLTMRELDARSPQAASAVKDPANALFASAASLWEIAIKTRIGKLDTGLALGDLPSYFETIGLVLLPIDHRHAVTSFESQPPARDPFDHMLLARCLVESMRLVTLDRALSDHPLAWRRELT